MILGILLSLGDSLERQLKSGQLDRFTKYYLVKYARSFSKTIIFSYGQDRNFQNKKNFTVIANKMKFPRFLYSFIVLFLEFGNFKKVSVFRCMQITAVIPAIFAKIFLQKSYVTTYGYKYHKFAKIEGKYLISFLLYILEYIGLKLADGVIVTTEELRQYVSKYVLKSKIFLIPNGVDINVFKPAFKKLDRENIKIVSVGRLEKQKNYLNLIRAISRSKHKRTTILTLVGRGKLKKPLIELASKLSVKLKIIESLPNERIPQILRGNDLFVLPSLIEGHPKSLIEAMACGLACIGTDVDGINSLITDGKSGLLCNHLATDITKKVDKLLSNDKLRVRLAKSAREMTEGKFNIDNLVSYETEIIKK